MWFDASNLYLYILKEDDTVTEYVLESQRAIETRTPTGKYWDMEQIE